MAVDLGGALRPGDRRLRIETSMEVFWDQAFIALSEPVPLGEIGRRGLEGAPRDLQVRPGQGITVSVLPPGKAELRFRGFPRDSSPDGRHPAVYDYDGVAPAEDMKPFPGRYTRYGQVADLLENSDDRFAILGEGDEVLLSFLAEGLPPLGEGRRRTCFLAAVGYCKDMDLYTAASDRVEPLPFRAMSAYPPPEEEMARRDPVAAAERAARDSRIVVPFVLGRSRPSFLRTSGEAR
jgi:hypothetical protein